MTDDTTTNDAEAAPAEGERDVTPLPKEKDKAAVAAAEKQAAKPTKATAKKAAPKKAAPKKAAPKKAAAAKKDAAEKPAKGPRRDAKLAAVTKTSDAFRAARDARDAAIRDARDDGFVLRELAEASGYANQTIRRVLMGGSND